MTAAAAPAVAERPLTDKQLRFVAEYPIDLDATKAAQRAGYSERSAYSIGSRMLKDPRVQAAIAVARAERAERCAVTADWVLTTLVENAKRAMQAEPVLDKLGHPTGEYTYQGAVANGALKLIGLHLGMFTERHELTGRDGKPIQLEHATKQVWNVGGRLISWN